jgi:hypothetical protein
MMLLSSSPISMNCTICDPLPQAEPGGEGRVRVCFAEAA